MRLNKIVIKNFRNYIGTHEFLLDKDITILYGNNGFGKSSFFDAIEWALTGKIERFEQSSSYNNIKSDLINKFIERENGETECSVLLYFDNYILNRRMPYVDGEIKNMNVKITNLEGGRLLNQDKESINGTRKVEEFLSFSYNKSKKLENFSKYMKQANILSQDQIKEFVSSNNSTETFESIANIMGLKSLITTTKNLDGLAKNLNQKLNDYETEMSNIERSIKENEKNLLEIDRNFLIDYEIHKENFKIKDLEKVSSQIEKKKSQYIIDQNNNKTIITSIDGIDSKYYKDYSIAHFQMEEKKNKDIISDKTTKYSSIRNKAEEKLQKLKIIKNNIDDYNNNVRQVNNLLVEFEKYNIKKENMYNNIEKIERENVKISNELNQCEFYLLNHKRYNESEYILQNHPVELEETRGKIELSQILLKKRKLLLTRIENEILNNENSVLKDIYHNINEILKYTKRSNENNICPVCSSDKNGQLVSSIEENILRYSTVITKNDIKKDKIIGLKNNLNNSISTLRDQYNSYNKKKNALERNLLDAKRFLMEVKLDEKYDITLFENTYSKMEDYHENILKKRNDNNNVLKLYEQYTLISQRLNSSKNHTIKNQNIINKEITLLTELIPRIDNRVFKLMSKTEDNNLKLLDSLFDDIEKTLGKEYTEKSLSYLKQLLMFKNVNINNKLSNYVEHANTISDLRNNKLRLAEIEKLKYKKDNALKKSEKINNIISLTDNYQKSLLEQFGGEVKDFLNKDNSLIQKLYSILNPMPSRSNIKFSGGDNELKIGVSLENENAMDYTSPYNVLSSGQLNVLAISIFLAINLSQSLYKLEFIAIDDPIQNMDDINQFSICDILGTIEKQLIFSTHDDEFLKLFLKKNEENDRSIQVYHFKSPFLTEEKVSRITP